MEKYYSHYRGATKVWQSRPLPRADERARNRQASVFYRRRLSPRVISRQSLVIARTIQKNNSIVGFPIVGLREGRKLALLIIALINLWRPLRAGNVLVYLSRSFSSTRSDLIERCDRANVSKLQRAIEFAT